MKQEQTDLTILFTGDIHGNIFSINYGNNLDTHSGLGKIATLIKKEREKSIHTLLIDNGDLIQGTPLSYHYAKIGSRHKENPIIKVGNALNYDGAVIGNHEFNFGLDLLWRSIKESNFPWLSANILDAETREPLFGKPYFIKEFKSGLRVAVLGMTTHYIPYWENPNHIEGIEFEDALASARNWIKYINKRESYDLLVVSYHGGFEKDLSTGEPTEALTGENQGYQMCYELEGIDVLLTGHQHRKISDEINGVTVVQPGFSGQALGKVNISFERIDGKWKVIKKSSSLLEVSDSTEADRKLLSMIQDDETETQKWLDQPIGNIVGDMSIKQVKDVRLGDHPLIEFINKVQMDAAGVDISCTALLNNESPGFSEHVTMRDIVSNYIYPNTLKVIRISGQDMKDALEKCASYFILDSNNEIAINPSFVEPKPQHYNYDMWEGIEYDLDISKSLGERVVKLTRNGADIDSTKEYDVVMNNYRAGGGGDYVMFKDKLVIKEIQTDMTELISEYIMARGTITATCNHNWRVIS